MRKRLVFIIIAIAIAVLSSVQTIYADEEIDMTTNKAVTIEQNYLSTSIRFVYQRNNNSDNLLY